MKSHSFLKVVWMIAILAILAGGLSPFAVSAATAPQLLLDEKPISSATKLSLSFAPIVKKVAPSVVNIYTTKTVKESARRSELLNDPFWRKFFGENFQMPPKTGERVEQSLGSGVIVSQDGYILSNSHVVDGADEIQVSFAGNGQKEYIAKLVGSDPRTDIAVLKIEAEGLPAITLTDSEHLEVGDIVMAIGNPFGIGQTVTMGIVSAKGRGGFGLMDYEDFIQTDASINPGNSGGALVDAEGRLVGVNSLIISRSGGNQGIGFAVPINLARFVMERIIQDGKVVRGFLGVRLQELTLELAKEFGLGDKSGILIAEVVKDSPGAKAGVEEGDVAIEFEGKKVGELQEFRLKVAMNPPGAKVKLKIIRDGKEKDLEVTLGAYPEDGLAASGLAPEDAGNNVLDGVEVGELDQEVRRQLSIPDHIEGALVTDIDPESAAYEAGLRVGSVILEVNRERVRNAEEAVKRGQDLKSGRILLRIWVQGGARYLVVDGIKPKP